MDTPLVLSAELVPSTSWGNNLRKVVKQADWDRLRRQTYVKNDRRCSICGDGAARLHCHEIWAYDDETHVQRLTGLIALCGMCHHAKHLAHSGGLAAEGKLDYSKVVEHFMRVNRCDERTFEDHRAQAFDQWSERSKFPWTVDLGEYANLETRPAEVQGTLEI